MSLVVPILKAPRFSADAIVNLEIKRVDIILNGAIDETTKLHQVTTYICSLTHEIHEISFDLLGVTSINSVGVRAWLLLLERISKSKSKYFFSNVSEVIIERASAFPDLLGSKGTRIVQFQAPYSCGKCKRRTVKTLESASFSEKNKNFSPPPFQCEKCGSDLEFDDIPADYFSFLRRH